jgi:hypothetical protein
MRRILTLAAGAALGLAPALGFAAPDQMQQNQAASPGPSAGTTAPGGANAPISDGTIGKAGAALRDVVNLQQKYQGRIESATPEQKQSLSQEANAEAVQAIQAHGLSVQEYSKVIRTAQTDPQVKQRLLTAANNQH